MLPGKALQIMCCWYKEDEIKGTTLPITVNRHKITKHPVYVI